VTEALATFGVLFAAGFAVTYVWRFLGVLAVKRIEPEGNLLLWVRAVATALVAALVVRISFDPAGVLAETATLSRVAALAAGLAAYYLLGRVEWGVAAAVATLAGAEIVLRPLF
jgi:branched-subunit amino acid transport protein